MVIVVLIILLYLCYVNQKKSKRVAENFSSVTCSGTNKNNCDDNECVFENGICRDWECSDYKDLSECTNDNDCEVKFDTCVNRNSCIIDNMNEELFSKIIKYKQSETDRWYLEKNKQGGYDYKLCTNITTIGNQKYCNNNQIIIPKKLYDESMLCIIEKIKQCVKDNKNNMPGFNTCKNKTKKEINEFYEKISLHRYSNSQDETLNNKLKTTMNKFDSFSMTSSRSDNKDEFFGNRIKQAFLDILNLDDKNRDKISLKDTNNSKKLFNYHSYINIVTKAYIDGTKDKNYNPEEIRKIQQLIRNVFNKFKSDGQIKMIFGSFSEQFEKELFKNLGFKLNVTERFDNGISYDENGNLREHWAQGTSRCYLITALTKANFVSLVQVYQLRKLMLEAFKVVSNRPFFHFYYDNFGPIADMLVKENRLSEILPNMLKCIDLSKNGQFDLAFEQYIVTARQAYQICKDMGMDTLDLEDKFEQLDGTIDVLPEPNNLFVENGFREALKSY